MDQPNFLGQCPLPVRKQHHCSTGKVEVRCVSNGRMRSRTCWLLIRRRPDEQIRLLCWRCHSGQAASTADSEIKVAGRAGGLPSAQRYRCRFKSFRRLPRRRMLRTSHSEVVNRRHTQSRLPSVVRPSVRRLIYVDPAKPRPARPSLSKRLQRSAFANTAAAAAAVVAEEAKM